MRNQLNNKELIARFELLAAATIMGSSGIFTKAIALPPELIAFFRVSVPAALLLIFFLAVKKQNPFADFEQLLLFASLLNAVRLFFFFTGYTLASIANGVLILYSWPLFAALFGVLFLREKITMRQTLWYALAVSGVLLTFSGEEWKLDNKNFIGMASMLLSAAIYALTVIIFKSKSTHATQLEIVFYQNIVGAFVFLPFLFLHADMITLPKLSLAASLGIVIGLLAFSLFFAGLKKVPASLASLFAYAEVPSALLLGILILGERPDAVALTGGALIVLATLFARR